jgi:plastocyanin
MRKLLVLLLSMVCLAFSEAKIVVAQDSIQIIEMSESGFSPSEITINQGDSVVFKNTGQSDRWPASNIHPTHTIYSEFDSKKPVSSGQGWQFTFKKAGIWQFHDHLDPKMTGTITVQSVKNSDANKEKSSFLNRITSFFSNFFNNLQSGSKKKEVKKPNKPFDPNISQEAANLYTDDTALYSYIKKFGVKQSIQRLNQLSNQYGDCHQIAHTAGRISYEVYNEKAFSECSAECHSGCYHGATEAYFKEHGTANLEKDLNVICSSSLNAFFSHQCLHGIGHGLTAWTNYNLPEALKNCDKLSKGRESCYTGVFMENIVGALALSNNNPWKEATASGAHYSKYLSDDLQYPCNFVADKYRSSCYFLQTSRVLQLFPGDFQKVAQACFQAPNQYQTYCFESMGRDVGGVFRGSPEKEIEMCNFVGDSPLKKNCLSGAIQDEFWDQTGSDQAISFCRILNTKEQKDMCYNIIIARALDILSKAQTKDFCNKIESSYQLQCLSLLTAH